MYWTNCISSESTKLICLLEYSNGMYPSSFQVTLQFSFLTSDMFGKLQKFVYGGITALGSLHWFFLGGDDDFTDA